MQAVRQGRQGAKNFLRSFFKRKIRKKKRKERGFLKKKQAACFGKGRRCLFFAVRRQEKMREADKILCPPPAFLQRDKGRLFDTEDRFRQKPTLKKAIRRPLQKNGRAPPLQKNGRARRYKKRPHAAEGKKSGEKPNGYSFEKREAFQCSSEQTER